MQSRIMDTLEIFLLIFVFAFAGARLYQKYAKKGDLKPGQGVKKTSSPMPSSPGDEEYEPYSRK